MKKICALILVLFAFLQPAAAQTTAQPSHMLQTIQYLSARFKVVGLPDYPPFSYYNKEWDGNFWQERQHSVFTKPLREISQKYDISLKNMEFKQTIAPTLAELVLGIREGNYQIFFGAYSHTKKFSGMEMIYPAVVSNPLHVFTLPATQEKIKTAADLLKLRGVACKAEYFSDFIWRKLDEMKVEYVETPYNAYERIFTGKADYLIGGLYYQRIMASRYGLEPYLAYSKTPLFKIPIFVAISRLTPKLSEYLKVYGEEFAKPGFAKAIKQEILQAVEDEVQKNAGIVPPSFAQEVIAEPPATESEPEIVDEEPTSKSRGNIVGPEEEKQKTFDEVLEGL